MRKFSDWLAKRHKEIIIEDEKFFCPKCKKIKCSECQTLEEMCKQSIKSLKRRGL